MDYKQEAEIRQRILDILRECQYDFDHGYSKAVGILNVRMVNRNKASYKLLELFKTITKTNGQS